jgi:hypothetical protein
VPNSNNPAVKLRVVKLPVRKIMSRTPTSKLLMINNIDASFGSKREGEFFFLPLFYPGIVENFWFLVNLIVF